MSTLAELEREADTFDALAAECPTIDGYCSSTAWVLPAHRQLMPPREPWILRSDQGWVALARGRHKRVGRYLQPLEAAWRFSSPFVAKNPTTVIAAFVDHVIRQRGEWDSLLLSGLVPDSPEFQLLLTGLGPVGHLWLGSETVRHVASLDGGWDGFLGRRKSRFRTNLRRAERRAREEGVTFKYVSDELGEADVEALFARILDIEGRSWKGPPGAGIQVGSMRAFYHDMLHVIAPRGRLRVVFAQRDGTDLAYVFGGILGDVYRGLQLSYDSDHARLSLGNLVQAEMIRHLCDEGVSTYDMGCDIDYKRRWAETSSVTVTLGVFNR